MTLDELISSLTTWRDLKKIGDAKVLVMNHPCTWLDVEQVTFGANGAVYIQPEERTPLPDDVIDEVVDAVVQNGDVGNMDRDEARRDVRKVLGQ